MYRSPWELAIYVRYHIADLADEHRACSPVAQSDQAPARMLTQLRHRLGITLIKVGRALAGYDALRGLAAPPARPVTWGPGS
jgi:hypothetical protein